MMKYNKLLVLTILVFGIINNLLGTVDAQECFDPGDCLDTDTPTPQEAAALLSRHHEQDTDDLSERIDILILICTQSFTGEELVEDVLLDALFEDNEHARLPPSLRVGVHLVDEAGLDWTEESLQQQQQSTDSSQQEEGHDGQHLLLSKHASIVLVVASTYGDGDPPNHALQFAHWLNANNNANGIVGGINDPIQYAVFGLGDKTYAHYNKFGLYIDEALEGRGGNRLLPVYLGDTQQDLSGTFQQWTHALVHEALPRYYFENRGDSPQEGKHQQRRQQQRPLFSSTGMDWRRSAMTPGSIQSTVVDRRELLDLSSSTSNENDDRSVLHVALEVPPHELPFPIQPGDHLGIHPRNPSHLVYDALQWLGIKDGSSVRTTTILERRNNNNEAAAADTDQQQQPWMERKICAYEFLEQQVDLAGRATPSTLRALMPFAGTLRLRALARELTFVNTTTTAATTPTTPFDEWMANQAIAQGKSTFTKLDLAKSFDCRPSLQALARALGPLQPRLYSIATVDNPPPPPETTPRTRLPTTTAPPAGSATTTIGICVSITQGGLCTNFLANLEDNSHVNVFVKQSKFHFVHKDRTSAGSTSDHTNKINDETAEEESTEEEPILMIAAGSGVGPLHGMLHLALEQRVKQQQARSPNYYQQLQDIAASPTTTATTRPLLSHVRFLVGARNPSEVLYKEKLQVWQNIGGVNIEYAFSRVQGQSKLHVQDLLTGDSNSSVAAADDAASRSLSESASSHQKQQQQQLWEDIFVNQGRIYACGRLEICDSVRKALWQVATNVGGMEPSQAEQFIQNMERHGKLMTDCWSVEAPPSFEQQLAAGGNRTSKTIIMQDQKHHTIPRLERHHQKAEARVNDNESPTTPARADVDLSSIPAWPSYLRMVASGEFEKRLEEATDMFSACVACGRFCEVDRLSSQSEDWGECRIGQQAIVSAVDAHFGEEPCLKGVNGSGTIFFGACNLKCIYCQNWKISAMDQGEVVSDERLAEYMLHLQERGCHNINFVSPTHNILPMLRGIYIAAKNGLRLPIVFNSGGYDSVASLRLLDGIIDIYMPDAKYASRAVARKLSKIDNYPEINQAAIKEMHKQVGDLKIDPRTGLAYRGLLVRHLVLPNEYAGTVDVADFLTNEVSRNTYTHVMKYYRPEHEAANDRKFGLNRKPSSNELEEAHKRARFAGLQRILY